MGFRLFFVRLTTSLSLDAPFGTCVLPVRTLVRHLDIAILNNLSPYPSTVFVVFLCFLFIRRNSSLHCGAVYCNRSCLWVCDSGRMDGWAGGRCPNLTTASVRLLASSVCVSLSAFFIFSDVSLTSYHFLDFSPTKQILQLSSIFSLTSRKLEL